MSEGTQDFISEVKGCLKYHGRGPDKVTITDFKFFCYKGSRISDLGNVDTSQVTNLQGFFGEYTSLKSAPYIDTSSCKIFVGMFEKCTSLLEAPNYCMDSATQTAYMFNECAALKEIPQYDLSKVTWLTSMFRKCTSLVTVPYMNTSAGTMFNEMFNGCTALTTISGLDLSKATDTGWLFINCSALTNLYLYNISTNLAIGSGTLWGHLLTVDSIVNTIKELLTVETTKTLSMGSANLEKIANLYCKVTDDTNPKLTMELCKSTDEGAMLLSEYAALKNWQFA